jgi:hypothetical protein
LLRKHRKLVHCVYIPLRNEGIELLHEICHEEETERDRVKLKRIRMVVVNIESEMVEMASAYNENINNNLDCLKNIIIKGENWVDIDKITTKELQRTLKAAKKRSRF